MSLTRYKANHHSLVANARHGSRQRNTQTLPYQLNRSKAIGKKLDACSRAPLTINQCANGQLTLRFSTSAFEIFRTRLPDALRSHKLSLTVREDEDAKGSTVQDVITVEDKRGRSATVNLYRTTSTCLINGASHITLPVLETIRDELDTSDISSVDNSMRIALEGYLKSEQRAGTPTRPEIQPISSEEETETEDTPDTCTKCSRRCLTRGIFCEHGNHWIHYRCAKMSAQDITHWENTDTSKEVYTCAACQLSIKMTSSPSSKSSIVSNRVVQVHLTSQQALVPPLPQAASSADSANTSRKTTECLAPLLPVVQNTSAAQRVVRLTTRATPTTATVNTFNDVSSTTRDRNYLTTVSTPPINTVGSSRLLMSTPTIMSTAAIHAPTHMGNSGSAPTLMAVDNGSANQEVPSASHIVPGPRITAPNTLPGSTPLVRHSDKPMVTQTKE